MWIVGGAMSWIVWIVAGLMLWIVVGFFTMVLCSAFLRRMRRTSSREIA